MGMKTTFWFKKGCILHSKHRIASHNTKNEIDLCLKTAYTKCIGLNQVVNQLTAKQLDKQNNSNATQQT